jgi:flagellar hook assembly protein FlgD
VPNPFRTSTRFVVDVVSPSGLPADVEIDIRALDGSPVRTLRSRLGGGGGRAVVEWDGRDRRGDEIANGTYLYIVRARFATEPPVTETSTGRVVLMR